MPDTGYVYNGIGHVEAQDRQDEERSGVPAAGGGTILLAAPAGRTSAVHVANVGEESALVRLRAGSRTKTQTNEHLTGLAVGGNRYVGVLARRSIVPGSVSITNAGAPLTLVDTGGAGILYDTATTTQRGTVNYTTGAIDFTYGAAPTEPVRVTYQHTDFVDFASPTQTTTQAGAAVPYSHQLGFGRTVPFSVASVDGAARTFVDDGKGRIIETTGGGAVVRGTVDYGSGLVTITSGAALVGTVTTTYTFNPFAGIVGRAGGAKLLDIFSSIPELTSEAWADGIKGETEVGLWGETRTAGQTSVVAQFSHWGEANYRVRPLFASFPPGGEVNNPAIDQTIQHL